MKVAITGENGFLGYHLTQYYKWIKEYDVVSLGRNYLENITLLSDCDLLIHCAGVNRGDNVYEGNINLAKDLVLSLEENNIKIDIKFTSSTQEDNDNPYGNSKLIASQILQEYCSSNSTKFESYKLPNLFGPFGKPNYNSFVNTFCYNLVNDLEINYNSNKVNLCFVYDAIKVIDNQLTDFPLTEVTVEEVYKLLNNFHTEYSEGNIPILPTDFTRHLFNTYRSFISPDHTRVRHSDNRGYLVELIKAKTPESQVFFSTTKPGITRGNHFHFAKVERFCVLYGDAKISMRKVGTKEIIDYYVKGEDNKVVDMPVLYTHNITNIGNTDLICVFWVDEIFDPQNMDTYFTEV